MNKLILEREKDLLEASGEYVVTSKTLQEAEIKYNLLKAKIMNMETVATLSNQSMRDAQVDVYLNTREDFKPIYDTYLDAKLAQKKAWIDWTVALEFVKNGRILVMNEQ